MLFLTFRGNEWFLEVILITSFCVLSWTSCGYTAGILIDWAKIFFLFGYLWNKYCRLRVSRFLKVLLLSTVGDLNLLLLFLDCERGFHCWLKKGLQLRGRKFNEEPPSIQKKTSSKTLKTNPKNQQAHQVLNNVVTTYVEI